MVTGTAQLRARFKRVPEIVRRELSAQMEKEAEKLVAEMNSVKPTARIDIGWTWGDAPKGSLTIGSFKGREFGKLKVTIYAVGDDIPAEWFEFGTSTRFHKTGKNAGRSTGKMPATPFFWPIYRANRRRIRTNLSRAVSRAMRKA